MRRRLGGSVAASDVSVAIDLAVDERLDPDALWSGSRHLFRKFTARPRLPNIVHVLMRTAEIASVRDSQLSGSPADLYLPVPVEGIAMTDFKAIDPIVALGRRIHRTSARRASRSRRARQARVRFVDGIAIIGIGCRFPGGADSPRAFWRLLAEGVNAVGEAPADRPGFRTCFDADPTRPGRAYSRWGGFSSASICSTRPSSASRRARRPTSIPSIACCSSCFGRPARTPALRRRRWPERAPAFSSASRRTTTAICRCIPRTAGALTCIPTAARRRASPPTACRTSTTCAAPALPSTPPVHRL